MLFPLAREIQEELEDVDEIQVERQGAEDGELLRGLLIVVLRILFLDVLRIPGGQADEDHDADDRDGELQRAGTQEDIDDAGDDDAEQAHHQERADIGEVALGRIAVEAGRAEHGGGDEEGPRDAGAGEDQEHRCQRQAHDGAEGPEHRLRGTRRHRLDAEREEQHEGEWRQHDDPLQGRLEDRHIERRRRADDHRDDTGHHKADAHVVVDAQHVLAQAFVKERLRAGSGAIAEARIGRIHGRSPLIQTSKGYGRAFQPRHRVRSPCRRRSGHRRPRRSANRQPGRCRAWHG